MTSNFNANGISEDNYRFEKFDTLEFYYPSPVRLTWVNNVVGEENPNWREQVRRGLNATTSATGWKRDRRYTTITGRLTANYYDGGIKNYIQVIRDSFWDMQTPDTIWDHQGLQAGTDLQARQRFVSNYRNRRTAFQTGVALGELKETVDLIKNPAKALRESLGDYYSTVKKRLRKSTKPHKTVADSWLEYSFGVAPLINDVKAACKLATLDPFRVFEPIVANASNDFKSQPEEAQYGGPGGFFYYKRGQREYRMAVRYKGAISVNNAPPSFPEQLGLSWSNVLPTVWELIPYSFLVDYFSNVGKVIEGASTGVIRLAWGCRTQRWWGQTKCLAYTVAGQLPAYWISPSVSLFGSGVSAVYRDFIRSPINEVSVGLDEVSFKLPGTGTQWINLAGLAAMRT